MFKRVYHRTVGLVVMATVFVAPNVVAFSGACDRFASNGGVWWAIRCIAEDITRFLDITGQVF